MNASPVVRSGLFALTAALAIASAPANAATRKPQAAPASSQLISAIEKSAQLPAIGPGAKGPVVVRAQTLLDREWFSPGEIDGHYSTNMRRAVISFQEARGIKPTGRIDAATWQALQRTESETIEPLARYVIKEADTQGPFERVPRDMMERSKRKWLGYETPLEGLAEKFHVSPRLLQDLNRGRQIAVGTEIVVPNVIETKPTRKAASIVVLKNDKRLIVLDAQGQPVATFPVSIGGKNDPLPIGKMKIRNEVTDPVFHYDPKLMWDAKPEYKEVDIAPGPNNPVGNTWLGLSKPHWGIHGTPEPALVGRLETHGCLHLTNWDARRLSDLGAAGFVVDVRE